jgi:beta-N-acetylhexosaminidase
MEQIAAAAPELAGTAVWRAEAALATRRAPTPLDQVAARAQFADLMRGAAGAAQVSV